MTKRTGLLIVVGLCLLSALAVVIRTWPRGGSDAAPGLPTAGGNGTGNASSGSKAQIRCLVLDSDGRPAGGGIIKTRDGLVRAKVGPDGETGVTIPRTFLKRPRTLEYVKPGFSADPIEIGGGAPVPTTLVFRPRAVPVVRTIRARIVDPKGNGVPRMSLLLGFLDSEDGAVGWQSQVESDDSGALELLAYDATSTIHLESADENWVTSDQPVLIEAARVPMGGQPIRIEARPMTSLHIMVSSAGTTMPAAFALIIPAWEADWSRSDRSLAFRFAGFPRLTPGEEGIAVTEIPDGPYHVLAARRGGPLCHEVLRVSTGQGLRRVVLTEEALLVKSAIRVEDENGVPVIGAVVAPVRLRLNDWMQLMNVHGRFGEETLDVLLDGRTNGQGYLRLLDRLKEVGMGSTDVQGKATLLAPGTATEGTVFVPGHGIFPWRVGTEVTIRIPSPPQPAMSIAMPKLAPGTGRGAVAWVENPFPVGGAYPEPVPTGFLMSVSSDGTARVPSLPEGRYRALAMVLGPSGEPISTGTSVEVRFTSAGMEGPTNLCAMDE